MLGWKFESFRCHRKRCGLPPWSAAGHHKSGYLNASLTFSPAFFTLDLVWSFLPSPSVSLSPVTLPACSLALPATSCAAFLTLSVIPMGRSLLCGGQPRIADDRATTPRGS